MFNFKDQVVMITGASSGLGADAASGFAAQGANLVLLARRKDRLDAEKEKLEKEFGIKVLPIACDVTKEEELKSAVDSAIATFGKVDVLINNAGLATAGGIEQLTDEEWDQIFNINVKAIANLSKYVIPHMKEQNYGRIINIASINAVLVNKQPTMARHSYNATKAAVIGLTRAMAGTYGVNGITVNSIGPGLFESEMTEDTLFKHEQFLAAYSAAVPVGRPAQRGELNAPLMFFASKEASYVTGQFLLVDGGLTIV